MGIALLLIFAGWELRPFLSGRPADAAARSPVSDATPTATATGSAFTPAASPLVTGVVVAPPTAGPIASLVLSTTAPISAPAGIVQEPVPPEARADFDRFFTATFPALDYFVAAEELGGFDLGDRQATRPEYEIGARETFFTGAGPRTAELLAAGRSVYFWAETGLSLDAAALEPVVARLDNELYPALSDVFGQEWRPGVDQNQRIFILHTTSSAEPYELGYFLSQDEYPQSVFEESNQAEMIYLNVSGMEVGGTEYYATLVHELQHLLQWNLDANEETWLNEGLSQLAELLVGDWLAQTTDYLQRPDVRLDAWERQAPSVYAHYGASYLYLLYLKEQLGVEAIRELARHPANGLAAVRDLLAAYRPEQTLESFTADWAVANYLDDPGVAGPYHYRTVELATPFLRSRARQLPFDVVERIDQYSVHYIDLDFSGEAELTFAGDTIRHIVDAPPAGGRMWYVLPQNDTRARLETAVDLRSLSAATLQFDVWHDLEETWDFAYVTASADGGETWQVLSPQNPAFGQYGPSFNGRSADKGGPGGWIGESISLSSYAGREILLRFEVLTDSDGLGRGFAVANVNIPQLAAQPEWQPEGFVETGWTLPQQWELRLIRRGDPFGVMALPLDEFNRTQSVISLGPEGGVLVVLALTPQSADPAQYWLQIKSAEER